MNKYSLPARLLHWAIAALVMAQIIIGLIAEGENDHDRHMSVMHGHYRLGLLIFTLMLIRLAWRIAHPPPAPPASEPKWRRRAAAAAHVSIYAVLITMPLSGYFIWSFIDAPMTVFAGLSLPDLYAAMPEDETGRAIAWYFHTFSARALIALIALHVGAALYHEIILRDRLVRARMF